MKELDLTSVRKDLTRLIEAGEPIAITRRGTVVAKLVPPDYHTPGAVELTHFGHLEPGSPYDSAEFAPSWVYAERERIKKIQQGRDTLLNRMQTRKKG